MIEFVRPCIVYNDAEPTKVKALQRVIENLHEFGGPHIAELKRRLKDFDGRSQQWKD